ncbi:hypothetical protein LCGC14_3121910 [marine sediment metagenome]|uniref:Uncharacterized protein n=1 Tax=marine sediment metagenome TaxID=412755 RepID=A0A0F8WQX1_9ZZZZ
MTGDAEGVERVVKRGELAASEVREVAAGAQGRGPAPLRAPVRRMPGAGEAGGLE